MASARNDLRQQIAQKIENFKSELLTTDIDSIFSKYIMAPDISMLGESEKKLRSMVASHFGIYEENVVVVGSAKLGFSPKPGQYFKYFGSKSDVDVAIISSKLFSSIWEEVFLMERAREFFDFVEFRHYHFGGWIRPDKMPSSETYRTCKDWWEFFNKLSSMEDFGRIKIRGGLYFSEFFLRQYQLTGLLGLKEFLQSNKSK